MIALLFFFRLAVVSLSDGVVVPEEAVGSDVIIETLPDSPDLVEPVIPDGTPCVPSCPPGDGNPNQVMP